jgi:hypothetical protein
MFKQLKALVLPLAILAVMLGFAPGAAAALLQNRVGGYQLFDAASRQIETTQPAESQQAIGFARYDTASECSVAAENAQVLANQAQGALGEAAVRQRLLNSSTVDLVGEQVRITTPGVGSYRVTDFLLRGRNTGRLRILEVKTGDATRDAVQLAKDALIADPLAPTAFTGSRAAAAGFARGTPTGPIRTFEVNASSLDN